MHGGDIWAAARATGRPPAEWVDFSASINPLGAPAWVRAAARRALALSGHYPDPACTDLVQAAAARYRIDPDLILFGNGAAELIHLIVGALAPPAGLVLAPTFARYSAALSQTQTLITELPAWPHPPDPDQLSRWLAAAPEGALLFLCNPNNPTGKLLPDELLKTALAQTRAWVVVDEAFMEFTQEGRSLLPLAGHHPRLILLRSLTKLHAIAGLRLGWLAGPSHLVSRLRARQIPWSVNSPAAAAGLAALTGPDWSLPVRRALLRLTRDSQTRLAAYNQHLEPCATDCNYYLVRLKHLTGSELQRRLLPHGILVRTCGDFTGLGDSYLRLAVRPRRELDRLITAMGECLP